MTADTRDATRTLRIGTRGSLLATTQAGTVRDAVIGAGRPAELTIVTTKGDTSMAPVERIGVGVFTAELREALLAGDVDIAVHSYKDLPTFQDPRLVVAAVPQREDPRDALVARDGLVLGELPPGARVGTSAPRRRAQLAGLGLGFDILPLRGNIDTRLGKVESGELDAIVIARAGLSRIGRADRATEVLDPLQMLPAPSQGALAVECRADDTEMIALLSGLDDPHSRAAVDAERAVLATLEAGCTAPVAALAEVVESLDDDGRVVLEVSVRGCVAALDGSDQLRASGVGPVEDAAAIGERVARDLLDRGARDLIGITEARPVDDSAARPGNRGAGDA